MKLCDLLVESRIDKNMTQQQVAEKLNVAVSTYQRWEYDMRVPNSKYLIQLIDVLDLDPKEINKLLK